MHGGRVGAPAAEAVSSGTRITRSISTSAPTYGSIPVAECFHQLPVTRLTGSLAFSSGSRRDISYASRVTCREYPEMGGYVLSFSAKDRYKTVQEIGVAW